MKSYICILSLLSCLTASAEETKEIDTAVCDQLLKEVKGTAKQINRSTFQQNGKVIQIFCSFPAKIRIYSEKEYFDSEAAMEKFRNERLLREQKNHNDKLNQIRALL